MIAFKLTDALCSLVILQNRLTHITDAAFSPTNNTRLLEKDL
jgi:hypothetical protein